MQATDTNENSDNSLASNSENHEQLNSFDDNVILNSVNNDQTNLISSFDNNLNSIDDNLFEDNNSILNSVNIEQSNSVSSFNNNNIPSNSLNNDSNLNDNNHIYLNDLQINSDNKLKLISRKLIELKIKNGLTKSSIEDFLQLQEYNSTLFNIENTFPRSYYLLRKSAELGKLN